MKIKISALRQMIKEEMEERGRLYKKAEVAAEAALEKLDIAKPRRGEDVTRFARFGAPIENEIHQYIKDNWPDIDSDEKFKIADKALSLAGIKLGVGPKAL